MSFTLAQLKTAIQDYTDNSETSFVTHLPDFIKGAEERIFKSVDLEIALLLMELQKPSLN